MLLCASLLVLPAFGQVNQDAINKAKELGASDAQIAQALNSGVSTTVSSPTINSDEVKEDNSRGVVKSPTAPSVDASASSHGSGVFGSEIFSSKNLTFAPSLNIPTPKDYTLASGDQVKIDIWGNSDFHLEETISPEGRIIVQGLGPISLSGLTIDEAERRVRGELSRIFSGLGDNTSSMSLTLGKIRSISINVVGEAVAPGTYTLPSLSTLFNALYSAGGVNNIGSLRSIKLYRSNKLEAELDVYSYLLSGNSDSNVRLEDGDMIIIEPYKNIVTTSGELKRARKFELKEGETLEDVINMAGGFKGNAYTQSVQVKRQEKDAFTISNIAVSDMASYIMQDADNVSVKAIVDKYNNRVSVSGAVWYPGDYELGADISTVKQLIEQAEGLKGSEFAGRAQLTRINPDFTKTVIAIDVKGIVGGTAADVALKPDDELYIPTIFDLRESYTIKVKGAVNSANNSIKYRDNMSVEDAIVLAGGLKESASEINVSIARRIKEPTSGLAPEEIVQVFDVTLNQGLVIADSGEALILEPFDEIYVRTSPGYREQEAVSVTGEVLFRGDYVLKSVNARLSDIISDAGGVTSEAYVKGASLKRRVKKDDKLREESIDFLNDVSNANKDSILLTIKNQKTYSIGIDLEKALAKPGSLSDIVLQDGDELYIPKMQSIVNIDGSVVYPNSVVYTGTGNAKDYVNQAGGYNQYARKRPVVVYMNGTVATTKHFLFFKKYPKIEPGCEVLVFAKRSRGDKASVSEILDMTTSSSYSAAMLISILNNLF